MTKKERIADLERRVAELEAEPRQYVFPSYPITAWGRGWVCPSCGQYVIGSGHACWTYTTSASTIPGDIKPIYISPSQWPVDGPVCVYRGATA